MPRSDFNGEQSFSRMARTAMQSACTYFNSNSLVTRWKKSRRNIPVLYVSKTWDLVNAGDQHRFKVSDVIIYQCNFGLLYGMGADGFRTYAETAYGVKMTEAEAHDTREKFFDTYKGLIPWHKRCVKEAKDFGQVYSPLGRIRHLPQIFSPDNMTRSKEERRAVNSRVQGALSDMSLWATAIMEQEGLTQKAPVILMVHDALYAYVPKDNYLHYMERYKDIMENLPLEKLGWKPKVPFRVDWTLSTGDPEKGIPPNFADLLDASDLKKKKGIAIDIG